MAQIITDEKFPNAFGNLDKHITETMVRMPVDIFDIDGNLPPIVINYTDSHYFNVIYASIPSVPREGWSAEIKNHKEIEVSPEWPNISYFFRKNGVVVGYAVNFVSFGFDSNTSKTFSSLTKTEICFP